MKKTLAGVEDLRKQVARATDGWDRWLEGSVSVSSSAEDRKMGYRPFALHHRIEIHKAGRTVPEFDRL